MLWLIVHDEISCNFALEPPLKNKNLRERENYLSFDGFCHLKLSAKQTGQTILALRMALSINSMQGRMPNC